MANNRTLLLINFLNRSITNEYRPFFEVIYVFEAFFIIIFPVISVPIVQAVWRTTSYHKNIRLRVIITSLQAFAFSLSRFVVLWHQYFESISADFIIHCGLIREAFIFYAIAFVSLKAFDRWVAMKAWLWYESGHFTTFFLFCAEEIALLSFAWSVSYSLVFGYLSVSAKCLILMALTVIGPTLFELVLRANQRAIEIAKGSSHSYSVARTFQLQENVAILTLLRKTGRPLFFCIMPAFLFFYVYAYVPAGWGLNSLRYASIALYDLWLAITSVILMLCLPYYETKFINNLSCNILRWSLRKCAVRDAPSRNTAEEVTNAYFDLLARHWENPTEHYL